MATDVASKGLDFPAIQHVINYDMPEEIENYGENVGEEKTWRLLYGHFVTFYYALHVNCEAEVYPK